MSDSDGREVDCAFLRITQRLEQEEAAPPVIPPVRTGAPSSRDTWISTTKEPGRYYRMHDGLGSSHGWSWISAEECSDGQGGPVTLSAPKATVQGGFYVADAEGVAELRALAADLLRTAEVFELLTGADPVRDDRGQFAGLDGYEPLNPQQRRQCPALGLDARGGARTPQLLRSVDPRRFGRAADSWPVA